MSPTDLHHRIFALVPEGNREIDSMLHLAELRRKTANALALNLILDHVDANRCGWDEEESLHEFFQITEKRIQSELGRAHPSIKTGLVFDCLPSRELIELIDTRKSLDFASFSQISIKQLTLLCEEMQGIDWLDDAPPVSSDKQGSSRRIYGSYFTPDTLSSFAFEQLLIPKDVKNHLTNQFHQGKLSVLDPSCGAGHMLVVVARHLKNLFRSEFNDLAGVFHGVDVNPLVLLLTALRIWREFGSPSNVSFYDVLDNFRCGNSLVNHTMIDSIVGNKTMPIKWEEEYPRVFTDGGFTLIIGNPPWERIEVKVREQALRYKAILPEPKKTLRGKQIERHYEQAIIKATKHSTVLSDLLSAENTYVGEMQAVCKKQELSLGGTTSKDYANAFVALSNSLLSEHGICCLLVPLQVTGQSHFVDNLVRRRAILTCLEIENKGLFTGVHSHLRFCVFSWRNGKYGTTTRPRFSRMIRGDDIAVGKYPGALCLGWKQVQQHYSWIGSLPLYSSREDLKFVLKLNNLVRGTPRPEWKYVRFFEMNKTLNLMKEGQGVFPVYEGKMIHQFNHRFAHYLPATTIGTRVLPRVTQSQLNNPEFTSNPAGWLDENEVLLRAKTKGVHISRGWHLVVRDATGNMNQHTVIATILPKSAPVHTAPIISLPDQDLNSEGWSPEVRACCLLAVLNSSLFDKYAKLTLQGTHLTKEFLVSLPIIPWQAFTAAHPDDHKFRFVDVIVGAVRDLLSSSAEMEPFIHALHQDNAVVLPPPGTPELALGRIMQCVGHLYDATDWV